MDIIIRTCGERTTQKCIDLAKRQGNVHIISEKPFAESIRKTYLKAIELNNKWTPVIDADVLLYDDVLQKAIDELNSLPFNIFCLDGKTDDKIFNCPRRAGIHIYKTELLPEALKYITHEHIKPESNIRRHMEKQGKITYTGNIIFGKHDFEQYYCDLWRKSVCQSQKLAKMIKNKNIVQHWQKMQKIDTDFKVILEAHKYGKTLTEEIRIDADETYNAIEELDKLGIIEKGEL
jgi:hypothetical protein